MTYSAKNYDRLLGTRGFSDKLLKTHFKLYEGYVAHINQMIDYLAGADKATQEYDEIKRRFAWEFNGMRLHEAYFGNMNKDEVKLNSHSVLARKLIEDFGSLTAWERDFKAVSAMRGIGWAVLAWDPEGSRFFNVWINEHDIGHLFYSVAVLVNDVFEHAYMMDYNMDRKTYVEAFMRVIDWSEVERRFVGVKWNSAAHQASALGLEV
jgi:Fe-Mn family superoxide dismutase